MKRLGHKLSYVNSKSFVNHEHYQAFVNYVDDTITQQLISGLHNQQH